MDQYNSNTANHWEERSECFLDAENPISLENVDFHT
jgi:hypothetical protein